MAVIKRSRTTLAMGMGTLAASAACSTSRTSFQSEWQREARRLMFPFHDQAAVCLVDGRIEKCRRQKIHECARIDAGFSRKGQSFRQRFEHRGDQKIARKLDDVGHRGTLAHHEQLWSHGIKQRLAFLNERVGTRNDHREARRLRRIGTPEHRRRQEALPRLGMLRGELVAQSNADGAERNVHAAARQRRQDAAFAEGKMLQRRIIRDHC